MFKFTDEQYSEFKKFLIAMKEQNWGTWPPSSEWPRFAGMPNYSLNQYQQTNGKAFVVVKFDKVVSLPDNGFGDQTKARRFKVGGDSLYQPVCPRF